MCAGNNVSEKNPIAISAYLKRLSGWARTVTPLEHDRTVTLNADTNDFAIYSRGGREYFLIENRRKAGRDSALPDEGLAIWHVDEDGDNSHEHMTGASHYELSLEQADGLFQLERLRNQLGDANDLFAGPAARFADSTVPGSKWWNGTSSNLTIDQITAAGASMTFRCRLSDTVAPPQTLNLTSTPNRAIPDNNATGISDTINVNDAVTISSLKVGVDITHTFRGDLRVSLITPWGVTIELHPKGRGGNADDLKTTFDEATRAGAGHAARAQHAGCMAADGAGSGAGRRRDAESLVALNLVGRAIGCADRVAGIAGDAHPRRSACRNRTGPDRDEHCAGGQRRGVG